MSNASDLQRIAWPDGRRFAFTIFDDTDRGTMDNVPAVYALLQDLGFRTTKSVWPSKGVRAPSVVGGTTCDDPAYLAWVQELQRKGFEIGLHNVTYHSSTRTETQAGLARFEQFFGHAPRTHANHAECREGIYWGNARVSGINRIVYDACTGFRRREFAGHRETDPHFWGDLCRENIDYVRNFVFPEINTLKACPWMPYFDPARPWVNAWFASSEGSDCNSFNHTLRESEQEKLETEGGACIMYTHFGKGFCNDGSLDARFTELMTRLSRRGGWFVPVATLLDHIARSRGGVHQLARRDRHRLERQWLIQKIVHRNS